MVNDIAIFGIVDPICGSVVQSAMPTEGCEKQTNVMYGEQCNDCKYMTQVLKKLKYE
jgi:hypothetical protein